MTTVILVGGIVLLLAATPAFAHHSFSMEFDSKQLVTLRGVVTKVEWRNPHTYLYVDVKNSEGKAINWTFETAGPAGLARAGWHRDSVKVGDQVTVSGYRSRAGLNIASARSIILMDGHRLSAASAYDGGPWSN
jgi:Family of unknown function (DUF6152)